MGTSAHAAAWPDLPLEAWRETYATLQLWTQIVGKIRLRRCAPLNHCWHVTLYVTSCGLTTAPMPDGARAFSIDFDFIDHRLEVSASDGARRGFALEPQSVAEFYAKLMSELARLGLATRIDRLPNEIEAPIPFDRDETHGAYDAGYANRYWRVLVQADRVLERFRAGFIGKCSPVHYFWGAADLAVTRFSGRPAPQHPGGFPHLPDAVVREAYSHELSSAGFWAGGGPIDYPAFYAYAYPEPAGFRTAAVGPAAAFYSAELGEFILPYSAVRNAASPDDALLEFLRATYAAAADLGGWERAALERSAGPEA